MTLDEMKSRFRASADRATARAGRNELSDQVYAAIEALPDTALVRKLPMEAQMMFESFLAEVAT